MTFLFDHDVPDDAAFALEAMGHQVTRLREVLPSTTTDEEVFEYANASGHILVTCNRDDFLSLIGAAPLSGLIVLVRRPRRALERAALVQLIERVGEDGLRGAIHFA
jgi:predicted nuclease of predicted toxin-antitoxin system